MKIIITNDYEKKLMTGEEVVLEYKGIATWYSNRFTVSGYDKDDLYQICSLEIYRAYIHYDYTHNIKFSTVAISFCKNCIKRLLRDFTTLKRHNSEGSDYSLDYTYNEEGDTLLDTLGHSKRIEDEVISKIMYEQIVQVMTEDDMKLIPAIIGNKSMEAIGKELGISKVAVFKRISKLKTKIQNTFPLS